MEEEMEEEMVEKIEMKQHETWVFRNKWNNTLSTNDQLQKLCAEYGLKTTKRERKNILMKKLFNFFYNDDDDIYEKVSSLNLMKNMCKDCCDDPADDPADTTCSDNDWWNEYILLFTNKLNELHAKSVSKKNILDIFVGDFEDLKMIQQIALLTDEENRGKQLRLFYQRGLEHWKNEKSFVESIDGEETRIQSAQSVSTQNEIVVPIRNDDSDSQQTNERFFNIK